MSESADATHPECVLQPKDVESFPINDVVVALTYNAEVLTPDPLSSELLMATDASSDRGILAHSQFMARLRYFMVRGYYILVRGWLPDHRITWSVDSIKSIKGSMDQAIEYQGISIFLLLKTPFVDWKQMPSSELTITPEASTKLHPSRTSSRWEKRPRLAEIALIRRESEHAFRRLSRKPLHAPYRKAADLPSATLQIAPGQWNSQDTLAKSISPFAPTTNCSKGLENG